MSGKHIAKDKKRNKLLIILIIVAIAAVVAAIIFVFMNGFDNKDNTTETTNPLTSTIEQITLEDTSDTTFSDIAYEETTQQMTKSQTNEETTYESIAIPTVEGEEQFYFSANYSPYKAVDTETSEEVSMRVVFGSGYSGGSVAFSDDGSFSDGLTNASAATGSYAVNSQSRTISATYTNDKNMDITVLSWNEDTPEEIVINYGGYDVYMN